MWCFYDNEDIGFQNNGGDMPKKLSDVFPNWKFCEVKVLIFSIQFIWILGKKN